MLVCKDHNQWEALRIYVDQTAHDLCKQAYQFFIYYHVETPISVLLKRFFVVKAPVFCEDWLTALVSAAAHYRETLTKLGWQRM